MTSLTLRDYQVAARDAVEAAWARGVRRPAVVLPTGAGKAQPVDEPVLTPSGWRPIGELAVGDAVVGSNGAATKVTGVFPQGVRPIVTVAFSDGASTRCDTDHLWSVQDRFMKHDAKRRGSAAWKTVTATELRPGVDFVPLVDPVEHDEVSLPLAPYTLGVLLGDGGLSITGAVRVHCRHDLIPLLILPEGHHAALGRDQGVMGNYLLTGGPKTGRRPNLVLNAIRELGLEGATSHTKFIPNVYLTSSSPGDRLALLQGLCDTDGHVDGTSVDYSTVSARLASDVVALARSLGGTAELRQKRTTWVHKGERRYGSTFRIRIRLKPGMAPVRVQRKLDTLRQYTKYSPMRKIVSVENAGVAECVCIAVDAPDQLYVTNDYVVTHNTTVFANIAHRYLADQQGNGGARGRRVLVLAHRVELIDQAARRIRDVDSDLRVGTVIADSDETDADVVVASIQTLSRAHRRERITDVGLVICDEAHHASAKTYTSVFEHFSDALFLGVTATMVRADGAALSKAWDEIVYELPILDLIKRGFLADIRGVSVEVDDLDLSGVRTTGGDFNDGDLGEAMEMSMAPEIVTNAYHEHAAGKSTILFAPTVAVAELMAHHLNESGVVSEVVTGTTPKDERRAMLKRFEAGTTKVLANCAVLTEGTDLPIASCIVLARPTKSSSLFVQMAGRALRPFPGKDFALLLDVAGATAVNNLCSLSTLAGRKVKEGESVAEAEERELEEAAASQPSKPEHRGPVAFREVDLFAASRWRWRRTAGGVDYLATGDCYIFVMPGADEDTFDVGWLAAKGLVDGVRGGNVREGVSEFSTAMEWAEQRAAQADPDGVIGEKDRAWHRKKATDKQVAFAQRLGIVVAEGARALEVSDAIDAVMASRAIDSRILPFLRSTGRLPTAAVAATG